MDRLKQATLYIIPLSIYVFINEFQKLFLLDFVPFLDLLTFTFENFKEKEILEWEELVNSLLDEFCFHRIHLNKEFLIKSGVLLDLFECKEEGNLILR